MPACAPGPASWVRASVRSVPAASRVPSGSAIRAAQSASAGCQAAAPGRPRREVHVGRFLGSRSSSASRSSRQVSAAGPRPPGRRPADRAAGQRARARPVPTGLTGPRAVRRTRSSMVRRAAGRQFELPAQQSRRGQGVLGRRVRRSPWRVRRRGPAQAGAVDAGGQFRARRGPTATAPSSARSVPSATSTGQPQTGRRAVLRRVIRSVPSAYREPLHADLRIRPALGGAAHRPDEPGPVGAESIRPWTTSGSRPRPAARSGTAACRPAR